MSALLVALVVGVIFVNGFTDAPASITGVVVTKTLSYRAAVLMAAACNLLGIAAMAFVNASVMNTVIQLAGLSGAPPSHAVAALQATMLSIIIFAMVAWYFGIPTSESHALIAALAASSLAAAGRMDMSGWDLVIIGLLMSLIFGLFFGLILAKILTRPLERFRGRTLHGAKIAGAAASAFMHGAQDGQKFIAVLVLAEMASSGRQVGEVITISAHIPALLICALAMSLGTAMGGRRIIHNIGVRMVPMDRSQGICSDIGSAVCLLLASLAGIPMSTTHAKTSAIMGAGIGAGKQVNAGIVGGMLVAWIITFPVCAVLGYFLTRLFIG